MVIFEDTRQQTGKHVNVHRYCEKHGIRIVRTKLAVGDYMLAGPGGGGVSVDTKTLGVAELASNCFQEHDRFRAECVLARDCGIRLIVLVEEQLPGGRLENWRSPIGWDGLPMHKFRPEILKKVMITMQKEYGVRFRFCHPNATGRLLMEYLTGVRE